VHEILTRTILSKKNKIYIFSRQKKIKMPSTHIERYIRSIFVQNIPAGITEDLFRQMLSQFGVLIHFHMFLDPTGANNMNEQNLQTSRGYAFAEVRISAYTMKEFILCSSLHRMISLKQLLIN
jgi:RNA recognition motif-containing protein